MILIRVIKKFREILSRRQKIRIIELGFFMVLSSFMEMLSVTMMLPFIEAVMRPEAFMSGRFVREMVRIVGIRDQRGFLVMLSLCMGGLYLFKNAVILVQMTIQNRFVYRQMFLTQRNLLRSYLLRPYEYFMGARSGEIMRIIGTDTVDVFSMLTQLISLFAELVVSVTLVVTVFVIAPGLTVALGFTLFFLVLLIQKCSQTILIRAGKNTREALADMNQWMLQSIQGIKEIKLMKREDYFDDRFAGSGSKYVQSVYKFKTLQAAPRFLIEAATMGTIFALVALMIAGGTSLGELIPVLSGIAMAAVRLLPATSRISSAMAGITYGEPEIDRMLDNLREMRKYEAARPGGSEGGAERIPELKKEIRMQDIRYRYPTGQMEVLDHAGMIIERGMSVGIVGASGAGKTTAVDILLGLLRPQGGQVLIDGTDIRADMDGWLALIGYIPQSIFLLDGTIRENVAFGVKPEEIDEKAVWRALKEASLDSYVRSLPEGLDAQIGERGVRLSGGQKQRIGIARALYSNPSVLFFDEATSALDNETEAAIMESIEHLHGTKTMVIIAHRLTTIENCDIIYRVEGGRIVKEERN